MAKKTVRKSSSKVQAEFIWGIGDKIEKSGGKKRKKAFSFGMFLLILMFAASGAMGGFFTAKTLMKNDCFILNGKDEITLQIGEKYTDEGAKVIAFGKDDSGKIKTETNMKRNNDGTYYSNEEGTFYIKYTINNLKYGTIFKVQKIRLITFVEGTEQEEVQGGNS